MMPRAGATTRYAPMGKTHRDAVDGNSSRGHLAWPYIQNVATRSATPRAKTGVKASGHGDEAPLGGKLSTVLRPDNAFIPALPAYIPTQVVRDAFCIRCANILIPGWITS